MSYNTPIDLTLDSGNYTVTMPQTVTVASKNYAFSSWEDGSTSPARLINLNADKSIQANYVEVIIVVNAVFSGTVTAQATVGEAVTVTVTLPGGSKDILTTSTTAGLTYTVSKAYTAAGIYSAVMTMLADAQYSAITTATVTFTVSLTNRTGTLTVTFT